MESKTIWNKLKNWLYDQIEIKLNMHEYEIFFAIPNAANEDIELINIVIIITKWYIINQTANRMNDTANKTWEGKLDEVLEDII